MTMMNMANVIFFWLVFSTSFPFTLVLSKTDSDDVSALNNMYTFMMKPSQLNGWKENGGDPCGGSWKGIKCSGSSVTEVNLSGLGLSGMVGYELSKLKSVTYFDVSKNNFKGDIPYQLPPKARHIDLSGNGFTGTGLPWSISQMTELKYLNLNRNQLKGQLGDIFGKLSKLTELDLSFNSLSGDLPQGFKSLSSLSKLHLQNNQFTGTINVLASLPLDDLDVSNNQFTGWVPDELKDIEKIETGGNSWSSGPAPPSPPGQKRRRKHSDKEDEKSDESGLSGLAIAGIVLGVLVVLGIIIALFSRRKSSPSPHFLEEDRLSQRRPFTPLSSQELTNNDMRVEKRKSFRELRSFNSSSSITMQPLQRSPSIGLKPPPSDHVKSFNDNEYTNPLNVKRSNSIHVSSYSLAELQSATGNFATGRLLGEGSIGRVYRAKNADGTYLRTIISQKLYFPYLRTTISQKLYFRIYNVREMVLAVKKIDSSFFQGGRGPEFSEIISNISKLRHPNIAELVGYCSEQGQNMLVWDYFRNGSLHEFLHMSDDFSKPLTWNTRVRIALGTARAVEYLHEVCSPSCVHKNIKSSNILLDAELNPRLSDCGLAIFHERTSQNLGTGYNAPECTKPSAYTLKSDVYSFGVVMLELLTGRMPYDSSKPKLEQSLVRWTSPQLHDIDALAKMVDPALRGLYPPKSLSRFADVIALCVQSEPEFRPPMSEVVEALVRLVQRSSMNQQDLSASRRSDDYDYY